LLMTGKCEKVNLAVSEISKMVMRDGRDMKIGHHGGSSRAASMEVGR